MRNMNPVDETPMNSPKWLTDVLAEHYPLRDGGKAGKVVCWCLWEPEERLYGFAEWDIVREHVADEIMKAIKGQIGSVGETAKIKTQGFYDPHACSEKREKCGFCDKPSIYHERNIYKEDFYYCEDHRHLSWNVSVK